MMSLGSSMPELADSGRRSSRPQIEDMRVHQEATPERLRLFLREERSTEPSGSCERAVGTRATDHETRADIEGRWGAAGTVTHAE